MARSWWDLDFGRETRREDVMGGEMLGRRVLRVSRVVAILGG